MLLLHKKEMGWTEIDETFTRFVLIETALFSVFVHRAIAEQWHPQCHDHPWSFIALVLRGGYDERTPDGKTVWRGAGSLIFRRAEFAHNTRGTWWSIVLAGPKRRSWGFV
jgi:hypothetical protein